MRSTINFGMNFMYTSDDILIRTNVYSPDNHRCGAPIQIINGMSCSKHADGQTDIYDLSTFFLPQEH